MFTTFFPKFKELKKEKTTVSHDKDETHIEKSAPPTKKVENTASKLDKTSIKPEPKSTAGETLTSSTKPRQQSNFLPNKVDAWEYYEKRNEQAKSDTNQANTNLNFNTAITLNEENIEEFIQPEKSQLIGEQHENNDAQLLNAIDEKFGGQYQYSSIDIESLNEDMDLNIVYGDMKRKTSAKEILEGITKRVVLNEMHSHHGDEHNLHDRYNSSAANEKSHMFMEPLMNLKDEHKNMIFANLNMNRRRREIEYNQLLECLSNDFVFGDNI